MNTKVAELIAISNEIFKRYNDLLEKQAQYESFVDEYGSNIVKKLVENDVIDQEQANDVLATMKKSATAPVKLLDTVVRALDAMQVKLASTSSPVHIGYPYNQSSARDLARKYSDIDTTVLDDFVIDISQLR